MVWINYVHSPDGELLYLEVSGIIKTMHTGFSAYVLHYANAPVLTRKKPDVMIWRGKICVVFWMLSVNSNELSKV